MPVLASDLEHELAQLDMLFQDFFEYRGVNGTWDQAIQRNIKNTVPPEISRYQEGIDFQSPRLEKALFDFISVLKMNLSVFDFYVHGEGEEYRRKERSVLLTIARAWNLMNFARRFDGATAEGIAKHGIKCMWLRHHPKTGEELQKWPFYWENTVIDGVRFPMPGLDGEADVFYYKYTVPVIGSGVKNDKGERVTLDSMGKIGWLGAAESYDSVSLQNKKIEVIVRDARRLDGKLCPACEGKPDEHVMREISVYVSPEGTAFKDAELASTTGSPFQWNSFSIVAGNEQLTEANPNFRYRPMMAGLFYLQLWQNQQVTELATLARQEGDDDMYLSTLGADAALIAAHGANAEGGVFNTVDMVKPGSNQKAVYPGEWKRYPRTTSQYKMQLIQEIDKQLVSAMPNRFLLGDTAHEASNATGTAYLAALQQAGIPFDAPLGNMDAAIYRSIMMCFHAIKYWAMAEPDKAKTKWTVAMTGNEHKNLARYGDTVKPGEILSITADELECDFDLVLKTENLTEAQRTATWLNEKDQYFTGFKTPEDVMRKIGIPDVEGHKEKLFAAKVDAVLEPWAAQIAVAQLMKEQSELLGYDIRAYMQGLQPGGAPPQGAPSQQVPPMGNNPGGENNLIVAPNAQMGRSQQQLQYAVGTSLDGPSGGTNGSV